MKTSELDVCDFTDPVMALLTCFHSARSWNLINLLFVAWLYLHFYIFIKIFCGKILTSIIILYKFIHKATGFDLQEERMPPSDCILFIARAAISFQQESALCTFGE